jgi:hypothetical protein
MHGEGGHKVIIDEMYSYYDSYKHDCSLSNDKIICSKIYA